MLVAGSCNNMQRPCGGTAQRSPIYNACFADQHAFHLPACPAAEEVEGGEGLQAEEQLARVAALGRASARLSLPLLAERLQGCLGALQQALQQGEALVEWGVWGGRSVASRRQRASTSRA